MKLYVLSILFALQLFTIPAGASTYYVGSCHAGSYASISAAVTAVAAGSTIDICPGIYNEQVFISKSLNLQGIAFKSSGIVSNSIRLIGSTSDTVFATAVNPVGIRPSFVITAPDSNTPITVNLTNIDVEQEYTPPDCSSFVVGIYYGSGASGTVSHSNVSLRDISTCNPLTSITSTAVWVENVFNTIGDTVNITNSTLELDGQAIQAYSGQPSGFAPIVNLSATGNLILLTGQGPQTGVLLNGVPATLSGNTTFSYERGSSRGGQVATAMSVGADTVTGNTLITDVGVTGGPFASILNNKFRTVTGVNVTGKGNAISGNIFFGRGFLSDTGIAYICAFPFTGANTFFNVATDQQCF